VGLIQRLKDSWTYQKELSKQILKEKYDMGAQKGKELKKQHKEKITGKKNEKKDN